MVGLWPSSWYPTHVTKNVVWTFMLHCDLLFVISFVFVFVLLFFLFLFAFLFFCGGKCKDHALVNMTCEQWKWNICNWQNKIMLNKRGMIMQWFMKMQHTYMIKDECRNDMSIMMPWRDVWCNQGTCQSKFAMCPLIEELNGKDPKAYF